MDRDSVSSTTSSRDRSSLCGLSGGRKSTTKESQDPNRKSFFSSFRKSPQKQLKKESRLNTDRIEPSTLTNCEEESPQDLVSGSSAPSNTISSPASTSNSSSNKRPSSSGKDVTKTKSGMAKASNKQDHSGKKLSLAARTRSFFRFRTSKYDVHNKQGSSENVALVQETSPTAGSSVDTKYGQRGTVSEIKPNTVSQRRAAFENLSGEQPSRPSPGQPSAKKGIAGAPTLEDNKLPSEERPSCSYQSVQAEPQLSSSSTHLELGDESGSKAEKKKRSKRSMPSLFKLFRRKKSSQGNVQDRSKGKDKKKTKSKEGAGQTNNNEDESFEVGGSSSTVGASSSHVKKPQSELKTKTVGKDAKQGKTVNFEKHSLLQEQNKSRESMLKAIHKGVENLTVPEQLQSTRVKSSPAIPEEPASAKADSDLERRLVEIPDNDDDDVFFSTPKNAANQSSNPSATNEDLDFLRRAPMLSSARKIKPQRNQKTTGNPLRKLAERSDVGTSYVETPAANKASGFTEEALRGLASKEDFSQVKLKKVESSSSPVARNQPFKEKMLLLVKGRKYCHARLVEPCARSVNTGDSYVLVTSNSVHVWLGESSNVLEKSKANDVAKQIVVKRDLGCKASSDPIVIGQETKYSLKLAKDFWSVIGEKKVPKVQESGPQDEDEIYEKSVCETNVVYKVNDRSLMPLEEHCGKMLSYEMLNTNTSTVLIFDFGGEMYVWTGKASSSVERQYGMQLAEELWKKGYDYTSFRMNPLFLLHDKKSGGLPLKDRVRPAWTLLGKVNQGMETILFKEKFFDWPNPSRIIQSKMSTTQSESKEDWLVELKPCDVDKMLKCKREPETFLWDGIRIGRSLTWTEEVYGLKKEYELETAGIDVWHVAEFACNLVDEGYHGNFFDGDTYVVRWRYQVNTKGVGTGKGGRDRCAYFFWQGEGSSITEKGACALMTIELDKEKGPQVRVVQNKEQPSFLMLFKGRMIVHKGKKEEKLPSSNKGARLYMVRNELPDEAYLMEIPVQVDSLRSRSSFLLLNAESDQLTIWHGARSPEHTRKRAKELVNTLRKWLSLKFGHDWKMSEIEVNEGSESAAFWKAIGSSDRSQYDSLLKSSVSLNCSLRRAFHLTAVTLSFEATEVPNPSLNEELCCPFPVFQSDLYRSEQPALFLIDSGDVIYLWQGYWPLESSSTKNVRTGSAESRFTAERRCAMETVLAYCKAVNPTKPPPAYVVFAGVEPISFTNLFPTWCTDENVLTTSPKDGRKVGQMIQVSEALAGMMKNQYTLAELKCDTLPDGVDAHKLESYLTDDEFKELFNCDKDVFYRRPSWKQIEAKKDCGLY